MAIISHLLFCSLCLVAWHEGYSYWMTWVTFKVIANNWNSVTQCVTLASWYPGKCFLLNTTPRQGIRFTMNKVSSSTVPDILTIWQMATLKFEPPDIQPDRHSVIPIHFTKSFKRKQKAVERPANLGRKPTVKFANMPKAFINKYFQLDHLDQQA